MTNTGNRDLTNVSSTDDPEGDDAVRAESAKVAAGTVVSWRITVNNTGTADLARCR